MGRKREGEREPEAPENAVVEWRSGKVLRAI